jgi:beta-glucosidase
MNFPRDFVWGAATSAYQVEGASLADGKGLSIWDEFVRAPGRVANGETGDVACDHYHRHTADVALMRELNLGAYRFSISWPRVLPEGTGAINAKGLEFYDRLVDELLGAGIDPWVTLYHWDLPLELQRRGGWLRREIADWFADYARIVAGRLGDRVRHWITINEPQMFIGLGLDGTVAAPGERRTTAEILQAWHHTLLAHGRGVQAIRASAPSARVGIAHTGRERIPATESDEDIRAAREAYFSVDRGLGVNSTPMGFDPVYLGRYPDAAWEVFGKDMPEVQPSDLRVIHERVDFIGYNAYTAEFVRAKGDGWEILPRIPGQPAGTFHWLNVFDDTLYWAARFQTERCPGLPFVITENGFSGTDWVSLDGAVHDPARIDFMKRYLRGLRRAVAEKIPVSGYFYWTLMDNFEWAEGYRLRFGLIHVDYRTLARTIKDSGRWYAKLIGGNGAALAD